MAYRAESEQMSSVQGINIRVPLPCPAQPSSAAYNSTPETSAHSPVCEEGSNQVPGGQRFLSCLFIAVSPAPRTIHIVAAQLYFVN